MPGAAETPAEDHNQGGETVSKKSETTNNRPAHTLADELVARGHVPADGRDALAAYLDARQRYLDRFGARSSRVQDSLGRLEQRAAALAEAAAAAGREASRFRALVMEEVLPDLHLILDVEDPALASIEEAAERLWSVPEAGCDAGPVMEMARRQAEAHARLQNLLSEVKRQLDEAGPADSRRRG